MTHDEDTLSASPPSSSKSGQLSPSPRPKPRKSIASLHDEAATGRFSLAHELAHALMPEPSAGSKLLAEEFGIEYDEGAEGIDETPSPILAPQQLPDDIQFGQSIEEQDEIDPTFGGDDRGLPESPTRARTKKKRDAVQTLERDLSNTNRFLDHLRSVDGSSSSSGHSPTVPTYPGSGSHGTLEALASSMIQKLNASAQDRESQVRELLNYEREFRKMSGDVLGSLDELPLEAEQKEDIAVGDLEDEEHSRLDQSRSWSHEQHSFHDEQNSFDNGDSDSDESDILTPTRPSTPPPPLPSAATFSPSQALPQLAYIRKSTTSLVSSLTTLSEQAQINSVFTTEAGRKIRALRGKLGEWKEEYDEIEKSKARVVEWERDDVRGRGKKLVQVEMEAFEKVLVEMEARTREILAAA